MDLIFSWFLKAILAKQQKRHKKAGFLSSYSISQMSGELASWVYALLTSGLGFWKLTCLITWTVEGPVELPESQGS